MVASVTTAGAASALLSQLLGVEPQVVVWALIGGFFGAARAPKVGWFKAALQYLLASLLSALAATVVAKWIGNDSALRNLLAGAFSIGFYPLMSRAVERMGDVFDSALERVGIRKKGDMQ
jgi:hypothetical protein